MVHSLVTLHAAENTILVCSGAFDSLPSWLTEEFKAAKKGGLDKRREVVAEIREYLETNKCLADAADNENPQAIWKD